MDLLTKAANTSPNKKVKKNRNQFLKPILITLVIFILILGGLFFSIYFPAKKLITQIDLAKNEAQNLQQSINNKDIDQIKISLSNLKQKTDEINQTYSKLKFVGSLPYLNQFYKDGQQAIKITQTGLETGEILIAAIEPYKDFLGIKGGSTSSTDTAQDRIEFLTQSIEGLTPYLDTIESKIAQIDDSINQINASKYPDEFKGIIIKPNILKAQESIDQIYKYVKDGKPLLTKISWLLGKDSPRKYLMIFQNDGELRPSGGFWTAYSTITVNNGKVIPGSASNIYDLDDAIGSLGKSPRIIQSYHINVPNLYLRDSNLSPDFPTDAQFFLEKYTKVKKGEFDAVIAIDTQLLVDMVSVLGKLDTRVGTFTTQPDNRCDGCPQIIYEMQYMSGRPRNYLEANRKDFMNPLMSALLANIMGSEKNKMGELMQAFFKDINQKHILVYFPNSEMQQIGNSANITGKIFDVDKSIDYFHLNDANFASAKSNIFITQKIKHNIDIKAGIATHKISITYTNSSAGSNCNLERTDGLCLNASTYRDLFRFYIPIGSKLIKMTGSEVEPVEYEELNKQVFEGFYGNKSGLNPKSSLITSIEYTSGTQIGSIYTLMLQKQPGTKTVEYDLTINGKKQSFEWSADKTIKFSL
jgi:hypothetical protein